MKKFLLMTLMLVFGLTFAVAQNQAEIKFDKVSSLDTSRRVLPYEQMEKSK